MSIINDLKIQYKTGGFAQQMIFWNVGLFAFPLILLGILSLFKIYFDYVHFFQLSSDINVVIFKPWTLISYGFFHADFFHLFFNMLMLFFSANLFKTFFSEKQLINFYFSSLVFSGLVFIASGYIFPAYANHVPLVGASGAIMAVLMATTVYAPNFSVRLLLIGQVKLIYITAVFILIDFIQLSSTNSRGHMAHLGGALFGYLFVNQIRKGKTISLPFYDWYQLVVGFFKPKQKKPFKTVYKNSKQPAQSFNNNQSINQKKIDDILDKISASGYDSLTKEEKEFLFNAKP
jgi:membrane associated rhomboid family serine protease